MTSAPELDVAGIRGAFLARLRSDGGLEVAGARTLVDRLAPERWTLEWYLPWWLGHALGLEPATSRELVLSNLLGLASIRLQDDLADAEVDGDEPGVARLAARLYEAALAPYRRQFAPTSPFWPHLEATMSMWRQAAAGTGEDQPLASRGAPLKVVAYAECLVADRLPLYPAIGSCLDSALEALVRYDHVADWRADLAAGRWNAFVAEASAGPQVPEARPRHHRNVTVAMLTTDVLTTEFDRIRDGFALAARLAADLATEDDLPLDDLVGHLRSRAAEVETQGAAFAGEYRALGDRAAKLLLPPGSDGGS